MFRQVLYVQWKWARLELLAYAVLAFLAPTFILKAGLGMSEDGSIGYLFTVVAGTGIFFVALAFVCSASFAVRPWLVDQSLRHVSALSLPVRWATFVRFRFLAGALLLVVPTLCVWLGGALATATTVLPPTLHAYPGGVAVRFLLSSLVFYASMFLLQYVAGKHAGRIVIAAFGGLLLLELGWHFFGHESAIVAAWNLMTQWPGPFETLSARWMLFDV
jgi:hypothetical protein